MTAPAESYVKRLARSGVQRLLRTKFGEELKSWMRGSGPADREGIEVRGNRSTAEVIAYFGDSPDKLYQLEQWLPALETLNSELPTALVFRQRAAFAAAKSMTWLPQMLAVSYPDLTDLYANHDYKLAIYVNNSMRNFQSMAEPSIVHVHVDHGESDKSSSISNQLKAYDKVFVAGPAAKERCERSLWAFDQNKLVTIGRPPLDGKFSSVLPRDGRRTVVYAPTWQGESEANNFTSVDVLGPQIVESLLDSHVRVVYRPHPRTTDLAKSKFSTADRAIRAMIDDANEKGGSHIVSAEHNILDLFEDTDVLIADISSVGLDFLYLHTDRGLILTDRHNDPIRMLESSPIGSSLGTVSLDTLGQLSQIVEESLNDEGQFTARKRLKNFYFGVKSAGESTGEFVKAVENAVLERDDRS